ncbi:hypothetical protein DL95DRAFT_464698 [Leptodontidium sp. 2 PMI_412]|nr:hypothetical protein DL95DRAFT_464698 [Leptodontidium sp. 2 PMI_412]
MRPCPRCPHRLSDLWTHVYIAELEPSQAHERPSYTSNFIQPNCRKGKSGSGGVINNQLPSYEAESSLASIQTNRSTETLVADIPAELHDGNDPEDKPAPESPATGYETRITYCSHEEHDEVWAMSNIPGAPTPFNSPQIKASKVTTLNMEEVLDHLKI